MRAVFPLPWALAAGIAAWGGLFLTLATAQPAEPTKVGTVMDSMQNRWVLNATGHLDRGSLPIRRGMAMSLQVDGRSYTLSPGSSSPGKSDSEEKSELPKDLKGDARFFYRFPDEVGLKWLRYVRVDKERRGVRFLDVIENTSKQPRSLLLRFQNEMDVPDSDFFQGAATDHGVIISRESPMLADDTSGVIFQFSPELSPAMPMFLIGKSVDPWTEERRLESYQLKLERTGTLEPGKRAVFIHWIGSKRPQEKGKAEKVFERFFADGRLVDPGVPEDLQKDVVNFRASAFLPAEEKKGGTPLVMLERLTKRLKVEVGAADLLLLEPGSVVTGSLKLAKLRLERGGKSMDIAQSEIAAISGGGGRGREHQVFLRDGTVLAGRITMEEGKFKSEGVGEVSLNVDTMYHLILKTATAGANGEPPSKGVMVTHRGELLRLAALPAKPITLRTVSGAYDLNWDEVAFILERGEPDLGYDVGLKDGSRLVGLPMWNDAEWSRVRDQKGTSIEGVQVFAAEGQDVGELLSAERSDEDRPKDGWCSLMQGVIWAGAPGEGTVSMEAAGGITEFKATDLRSVQRTTEDLTATGASASFDVELAGGLKLRGRFTSPTLKWQRGGRVMELPWSRVTELKIERSAP